MEKIISDNVFNDKDLLFGKYIDGKFVEIDKSKKIKNGDTLYLFKLLF